MKKAEKWRLLALMSLTILGVFSGCIEQEEKNASSLPTASSSAQPIGESPIPSMKIQLIEKAVLPNDQGPVYSQSWSPDGSLIAVAGFGQVKVWSVEGPTEAQVLEGHASYVWGVDWSPDGRILASAGQDGTVRLWSPPAYAQPAILYTGWAFCLDWSPDGSQLVVGTESGEVQTWDAATKKVLHIWKSPGSSSIISIAWSPDGKVIVSGEWSGSISVWDTESGEELKALKGYTNERCDVNGLAWSPDGTMVASAHQDGHVRVWNVSDWQLVRTIDAHRGWVRGLAWSPDGLQIASTGQDKRACFWDLETGQLAGEVSHNFPVWSVAWSPDGTLVSTGSGVYSDQSLPGVAIVWIVEEKS